MKIEHIAFDVTDPGAMSEWYCTHLGMKVVKRGANAYFLSDETGHGILELYCNPPDQVPNYGEMNPFILHVAFLSEDLQADRKRLIGAGATKTGPEFPPTQQFGVLFLKDPWGFTIQLVRRDGEKLLP